MGCDTKKKKDQTEAGLNHGLLSMKPLMQLVGLSMDRLIVHQHVFANEVYLPMEGGCQDPVYNTWQILSMRFRLMEMLGLKDRVGGSGSGSSENKGAIVGKNRRRPVMMLMKRSSNALHTRNGHDSVRQWSDKFANRIISLLEETFPKYKVVLFSDKNVTLMKCHHCQIEMFADTDVLIGVHGAGLANMLYMRPNSAVVELGPYKNDGRCLLGGGPFSRLAAVMSHNYMIHHPLFEEFTWKVIDQTSEFDIPRFVEHIYSFVKSIDFL